MKIVLSIVAIFLCIVSSNAQSQTISKDDYEKAIQFAVSTTNEEYPLIFTVTTISIKNGKTVRTVTEINENESPGIQRIKRTVIAGGKETNNYQVSVGYGNVFCSDNGVLWKPSKYECTDSFSLDSERDAESIQYSVTTKVLKGKQIKIYREYSIFAPSEESKKKDFREKVSTMDSRGFFITSEVTEGTRNPKTVTLIMKESWITNAKIKPVVAPIK